MNYNQNFNDFEMNFSDTKMQNIAQEMRLGFIRKVYGILTAQLAVTAFMTMISMSSTSFQKFQLEHVGLAYFCLFLTLVLPCIIVCFTSTMRKVPNNYIILFAFTLAESYLVSFICAFSEPHLVFMAAFMTFCLVASLSIYALYTKTDFTMQGGMIFVFGCGVMLFGLFTIFSNNKTMHIIYCVAGIILFGLYLLYDTQLILGNKENALEMDDYILGAFMLYTDIIYLFLRILELLQLLQGNNNN
jgi:FtsH-binding integral membrane protein